MLKNVRTENHKTNKELCEKNPETFMLCPRCNGCKTVETYCWDKVGRIEYIDYKTCFLCNGNGVLSWTDNIIRGRG